MRLLDVTAEKGRYLLPVSLEKRRTDRPVIVVRVAPVLLLAIRLVGDEHDPVSLGPVPQLIQQPGQLLVARSPVDGAVEVEVAMEAIAQVGRGVGREEVLEPGHVLGRAVGCGEPPANESSSTRMA